MVLPDISEARDLAGRYSRWLHDHAYGLEAVIVHREFQQGELVRAIRALQIELARHLIRRHGHASYELILSGPGLLRLYEFLRAAGVAAESPGLATALKAGDPAAVLTQAALARTDRLATATVGLFVRIYGAQAGNLALAAGAGGGLYIAGGIAPRIVALLADGTFLQAFRHKGGMSALAATIPVTVVMNPDVGLLGAVRASQG
jgi:glucokinase